MIMYGTNVQSAADPLQKVQEDYFFHSLIHPNQQTEAMIRQLRVIYQINPKAYAAQKRTLPYVVCGIFNPPYRRAEHFAYTEDFIIDIDHLSTKELGINDIRQRLQTDKRVMMCFTSPSADGLKLMFKLKERCYDAGVYAIFYKEFLSRFFRFHHLEQVVEQHSFDVTRVCFVSIDPEAYYNPNCEPVDINEFLDLSSPVDIFDMKNQQDKEYKKFKRQIQEEDKDRNHDPDRETMEQIKQQLNAKPTIAKEKIPVSVSEQTYIIMDDLKEYIEATGLLVKEIMSFQYGKKVRIKMGQKEAEVNLFYGKRGFTVIKSPRCGTNMELNDICAQLIQHFIDTQ